MLLLPDNVRIRRFNVSSAQYSDYLDNAEHIQALDYLWDPQGEGLSKAAPPSLNIISYVSIYYHLIVYFHCKGVKIYTPSIIKSIINIPTRGARYRYLKKKKVIVHP